MSRLFFYDTEFIEGFAQAVRYADGEPQETPTIDLISIGIVSEDGTREFYGCNRQFGTVVPPNEFVHENVIPHLPERKSFWWYPRDEYSNGKARHVTLRDAVLRFLNPSEDDPVELWGYYSAYDHVALCWLFGDMGDLPPGMPMFTRDLMQLLDYAQGEFQLPEQPKNQHNALADARWNRKAYHALQASMERVA